MQKKIDYKEELNPAQFEAVRSVEGPHLVIAGAGSGKTRTLVYRVAYLVEKGIKPDEILLLTFTRKAAEEMLVRASLLLDQRCQRVSGGTFHSFANSILRRYAKTVNLNSNFTILDRSDSEELINFVRAQFGFNKTDKRFPRKKAIAEIISSSINKSESIDSIVDAEYPHFMEWLGEIKKIKEQYQKQKRARSLLDYDDLLVFLKNLLTQHDDVRLTLSRSFKYIMVDEYQDTNKLQAHIACMLASEHKNIMVVGDDSQSIYSFRGANFKNIMDFPKLFKGTKIITLEENYRSTQPILNMTNQVIRFAQEKFEKTLYTKKRGGNPPVFIDARDENSQSSFIAEKILKLRQEGQELKDIAVLFRSGWHSNDLEIELTNRGIPFAKYGGQKFVEAAHIKDLLSYLRIIYNMADQISWNRALLLMRGIGPKTAQRIIQEISESRSVVLKDQKLLNKTSDLADFLKIVNSLDAKSHTPSQMICAFLKYYQPLLKEKYDDFNKRINDLDSLGHIALRYEKLEEFLTDMALEPPEPSLVESGSKVRNESRLTLSTIHSAKGLEWKTVFLIYVAEGHLPYYLSLEDNDAIEEERRLFYVAVTRAKENLFLLKPHLDRSVRSYFDQGHSVFTRVSRFLEEGDILKKFVKLESFGQQDKNDIAWENTALDKRDRDEEFLGMMRDYFGQTYND
jgi:DNA helicase-2/ATP-dependent DNA helicase PcrA